MNSVIFGPSSSVTAHWLGYSVEAAGSTYWYDGLSNDELAMICGLYCCYTGNLLDSLYLSYLSWWPLPEYLDHQGNSYNWGHWMEQDELWYQSYLSGIQRDNVPLSHMHW